MARPLSPDTTWTIAGIVSIFAVGGAMAYLYLFQATVPEVPVPESKLNVSIITSELEQPAAKNVFLETAKLSRPVSAGVSTAITYQSDELGKSDIYEAGK